jgi:hypothetical protein
MIERDWLEKRYVVDLARVDDIAKEAGCGAPNVRRFLKKWKILRGKKSIIGKPAWNSGLTKSDNETIARVAEGRRGEGNPMFGKSAWNKGLTADTDERVASIREKATGVAPDNDTREKMRLAKVSKVGELSNAWKGGYVYSNGYCAQRATVDGRREYIHRLVAQKALKRKLKTEEEVHHFDRDKTNNSPSNLVVLLSDDHSRLHRAIEAGCESKELQLSWLLRNNITFEELN